MLIQSERLAHGRAAVPLAKVVTELAARELTKLTIGRAKAIAGTLGHPSKMPGYSYGLHARLCRTGSRMSKVAGSVCAGCFALKGFYATWRPALVARDRRHRGLGHPLWVDAMATLIARYCVGEQRDFRWHDSGDLQGPWHLAAIAEVARRTPDVRHWLPTREYADVAAYLAVAALPANLCVRLSALMIDSEPVIPPELAHLPTSTVHTPGAGQILEGKGAIACRAIELRDNICGDCRACRDPRVRNVSYPQH